MMTETSKPVPDPTELTSKAVRELKDQLTELFGQRFKGLDEELDRIRVVLDGRPQAIVTEIRHLEGLMLEKFKGVDQQFAGRDTALAAALQAAEKAANAQYVGIQATNTKAEGATTKEIEGIKALMTANNGATDSKINDTRDRLTIIESHGKGLSDGWGLLLGGTSLVAALGAILFMILDRLK